MSAAEQRGNGAAEAPSAQNPPERLCIVCGAALRQHREVRLGACWSHTYEVAVLLDGLLQRHCQQCNNFHPLHHFEGGQRSCRRQLDRRRQRRRVAALASCPAPVPPANRMPQGEEAPMLGRRPRRTAALQQRYLVAAAAAADEPEEEAAPDARPAKRQRLPEGLPAARRAASCAASCGPARGPPAQWPALDGMAQHPGLGLITDPALAKAAYAFAAANQQPPPVPVAQQPAAQQPQPTAAVQQPQPDPYAWEPPAAAPQLPNTALLVGSWLRLSSGGRQARQPGQEATSLGSYTNPSPRQLLNQLALQPLHEATGSERKVVLDQLARNMSRLLMEQARRFGTPLPAAVAKTAFGPDCLPPAALALPACSPGCLRPLALPIEERPEMTREEAQAQLATAAVVMALALKCELAAADRQQA